MTTIVTTSPIRDTVCSSRVDNVAHRLYCAECALEDARATGVDEWIAAASDRLHDAVREYLRVTTPPR